MGVLTPTLDGKGWRALFLPAKEFHSQYLVQSDGGPGWEIQNADNNQPLVKLGAATGIYCAANATLSTLVKLPEDVDTRCPIFVRLHWSADVCDPGRFLSARVQYIEVARGDVLTTAPSTDLDTLIPNDVIGAGGTFNNYGCTGFGIIDPNTLTQDILSVSVLIDAVPVGATNCILIGLEFLYASIHAEGRADLLNNMPWPAI